MSMQPLDDSTKLDRDRLEPKGETPLSDDLSDAFVADDYETELASGFAFADLPEDDSDAEFDRYFRNSGSRHRGRGERRRLRELSWEDALDFGSFDDRDLGRGRRPRR